MNSIILISQLIIIVCGVLVLNRDYKKEKKFGKLEYAFIFCLILLFICFIYNSIVISDVFIRWNLF